jgi:hypothetical protein
MPHKRKLHHIWVKVRPISHWFFVVLALISAGVFINAYRDNNLRMIELREQVFVADKEDGDVEGALRALREHVHSHMNTNLASGDNAVRPPIQLKYRYERLAGAENKRISDFNQQVYTDAQNYCERLFPTGLSGSGRVPCIEDYVARNQLKEQPVDDALYKFDFVSPVWSPDLAGWSLVATVAFLFLAAVRFLSERWLQNQMSKHS